MDALVSPRLAPWDFDPELDRAGANLPNDDYDSIVHAMLGEQAARWDRLRDRVFARYRPAEERGPVQGWKLHLSATVVSAPEVLRKALPVIVQSRVPFKLLRSPRVLAAFTGANTPLDAAGKFITVYPASDEIAADLGRLLVEATAGLAGQRIGTDRPLGRNAIVSARYGPFSGARKIFSPFAEYADAIVLPDGTLSHDSRRPGKPAQDWVADPFPPIPPAGSGSGATVTLGEFAVSAVIKRSNGGSVYRGERAGQPVVIKEARAHIATDVFGRDLRNRRRHEHAVLTALTDLEVAPRPYELFGSGDVLFLAMSDVGRSSLRTIAAHRRGDRAWVRMVAAELARCVERCHSAGVIVRDLHPGNVVCDQFGVPRLVDLELAWFADGRDAWFSGATLGYASPGAGRNDQPCITDDVYGLGATLFFLVTGLDPLFLADSDGRDTRAKAAAMLAWFSPESWAAELIPGCLASETGERPAITDLLAAIERPPARSVVVPLRLADDERVARIERAIAGAVTYLHRSIDGGGEERLWPTTRAAWLNGPHCAGTGTAGIGLALCELHRAGYACSEPLERAIAALETAPSISHRPNGLFSGDAGTALFWAHAGTTLNRRELTERAINILSAADLASPWLDVPDGIAGLLVPAARLWLETGDSRLARKADAIVRRLVDARKETVFGPGWTLAVANSPNGQEKVFPEYVIGIATALLIAGCAFNQAEWAHHGVETLDAWLEQAGEAGAANWSPTQFAKRPVPFADKGLAGIGAWFTRAAALTGSTAYRDMALSCANMLVPVSPASFVTLFHGIAGIGEFFIDLEDLLGLADFRPELDRLVDLALDQAIDRIVDGHGLCFPDEDGLAGADFGLGTAGVVTWLLRYRDRGPRLLHADEGIDSGRANAVGMDCRSRHDAL